jgi:hypothetical protein
MPSRIPAFDALAVFVPDRGPEKQRLWDLIQPFHRSRWFPQEGGHLVRVPYQGEQYDPATFTLEKGTWDHEHCDLCNAHIDAMTRLWFTRKDPYIQLCADCYNRVVRKPWWRFWSR